MGRVFVMYLEGALIFKATNVTEDGTFMPKVGHFD
jgi:hypothetical protein